jgi:hypothetical protein
MATIQERIQALIADDVQAKKVIEVYRVAEAIRLQFPHHHLENIVAFVSEEVVALGGNAHWEKDGNL